MGAVQERKRLKVIANPISGRGRAARLAPRVIHALHERGCHIDYFRTRAPGEAQRLAASTQGYDAVVVLGGDGTINEVVNGLDLERAPPVGIIPSGTANVLAKELGLPWTVAGLAETIARGRVVTRDVGVLKPHGRRFALFAGAGFASQIVDHHMRARRGPIHMGQYIAWGLETFRVYRPPRLTVETDGHVAFADASWVEVVLGPGFGGPLALVRHARPDDGVFDVMISTAPHARDAPRMIFAALWRYFLRAEYPMRDTHYRRAARVRVTSAEPFPIHVDGDPCGSTPFEAQIIPSALRVLAPA